MLSDYAILYYVVIIYRLGSNILYYTRAKAKSASPGARQRFNTFTAQVESSFRSEGMAVASGELRHLVYALAWPKRQNGKQDTEKKNGKMEKRDTKNDRNGPDNHPKVNTVVRDKHKMPPLSTQLLENRHDVVAAVIQLEGGIQRDAKGLKTQGLYAQSPC